MTLHRLINRYGKGARARLWFGLIVIFSLVLMTACGSGGPSVESEEWLSLFNGKNLNGWTVKIADYEVGVDSLNTFRAEDGVLKVVYDDYEEFGGKFGHLFYHEPYSNYILRLEYRFLGEQTPGGAEWAYRNSGIMIHSQSPESMRIDQDFPVSIEVQLLGGNGIDDRPTANVCTPGTHIEMYGELITRHCTDSTSQTYHGDQWVRVEVEVHGGRLIRHIVEGETVLEYTNPQLDPKDPDGAMLLGDGGAMLTGGYICLQAEGHPCEFRSIELRILDE